jgi:hypothetical protein
MENKEFLIWTTTALTVGDEFTIRVKDEWRLTRPRLAPLVNFKTRRKFDQAMPSVSVSRVVNDRSRTTHRELPQVARAAGMAPQLTCHVGGTDEPLVAAH